MKQSVFAVTQSVIKVLQEQGNFKSDYILAHLDECMTIHSFEDAKLVINNLVKAKIVCFDKETKELYLPYDVKLVKCHECEKDMKYYPNELWCSDCLVALNS